MFDRISQLIEQTGYWGIALLMLLENVFPPIPSELIMPIAGYAAARGELDFFATVLAGTAGSLLGAGFWYYLGRTLGRDRVRRLAGRHGRWLTLTPEEVDRAVAWFGRHGAPTVFLGRLVPAVRTLISVPAGVARMSVARFVCWTTLGTGLWTSLLAGAGYVLQGAHGRVEDFLNPVTSAALAILIGWYAYRVVSFAPRNEHAATRRRN